MTNNKKSITLINLKLPYEMPASTLMMASPHRTSNVLQVLVYETEIVVKDLSNDSDTTETRHDVNREALKQIFSGSHTVVIPDAMFTTKSKVFYTEKFVEHGREPLKEFYQNGGNVIVMCLEGIYSIGSELNKVFGTSWKLSFFESSPVVPTERGREMLGRFLPTETYLTGNPYFIEAPKEEGLYQRLMSDKEQFVKNFHDQDEAFERLGIQEDLTMDCFNVEKSWEKYVTKYTDRYCICLHEGTGTEGNVVWYGDRGQSDTMAYVFCKMLNLGATTEFDPFGTMDDDLDERGMTFSFRKSPSSTLILSFIVVILAVAAKYLGMAYQ